MIGFDSNPYVPPEFSSSDSTPNSKFGTHRIVLSAVLFPIFLVASPLLFVYLLSGPGVALRSSADTAAFLTSDLLAVLLYVVLPTFTYIMLRRRIVGQSPLIQLFMLFVSANITYWISMVGFSVLAPIVFALCGIEFKDKLFAQILATIVSTVMGVWVALMFERMVAWCLVDRAQTFARRTAQTLNPNASKTNRSC